MKLQNPQTWVRIRRIGLRRLANQIGNLALQQMHQRPYELGGRAIKEHCEMIERRLDAAPLSSNLKLAFDDLQYATAHLMKIAESAFFKERLATLRVETANKLADLTKDAIVSAIEEVDWYIREYNSSLPPPPPPPTPAERVAEIIPEQQVGPAKFEMASGILRVQHSAATADPADASNAESARQELLKESEAILGFLSSANYDPRLLSTIRDIRERIESKQDVIQLGIAAVSCQIVCERAEEELPTVWGAKLRGFSMGIGMYVAQFSEWIRFSDNAALADFSPADVRKLHDTGLELVQGLRAASQLVDPEVPQTLAFLLEVINDPRRAVRRTVFAAMRTIENLVSVLFRAFSGILGALPKGVEDGVRLGAKYTTTIALLTLVANVAVGVGPAAGRILQSSWMVKAGQIINKGLADIE